MAKRTEKASKAAKKPARKSAEKTRTKRQTRSRPAAASAAKQRLEDETIGSPAGLRAGTKGASVIAMLRSPAGATVAAMMQETGWQAHSVRGFLASVVRRKLNLDLRSSKTDGERTYRIGEERSPDTPARRAGRKAE